MLAGLLPASVIVDETTSAASIDDLLPEERAAVAGAVEGRVIEFATGRCCAHRALQRLGCGAAPVLPGSRREPLWPDGVVGSITHCPGLTAAAVVRTADLAALGIDAETNDPLPVETLELVSDENERRMLRRLRATDDTVAWDRLLFSAKESIYKAWYPLSGRWLDFTDCELTVHPESGTFYGRIRVDGVRVGADLLAGFSGRWAVAENHILTAVAVAS